MRRASLRVGNQCISEEMDAVEITIFMRSLHQFAAVRVGDERLVALFFAKD